MKLKTQDLEVVIHSNGYGSHFIEFVDEDGECRSLRLSHSDLLNLHKYIETYINDVSGGIIDDSDEPLSSFEPNTGWPGNRGSEVD